MREHAYFTYIVSSKSRTLYIGVTSNLEQRIIQHKQQTYPGFTALYNCTHLVWFEGFTDVSAASQREKELKEWSCAEKVALIEFSNPTWEDLSESWYPKVGKRALRKAEPALRLSRR
jgi:putative endonuclease